MAEPRYRYLEALAVLEACSQEGAFGVEDPRELLQREMGIGRAQATLHLRELAKRRLIVTDSPGQGLLITRAYVRDGALIGGSSADDAARRLIEALRRHARSVSLGSAETENVVNASSFTAVHREADIVQTNFYEMLRRFEKRGWLRIAGKRGRGRGSTISSVWLLPTFPSPTPPS